MNEIRVHQLDCGAVLVVEPIESVRSAGVMWKIPLGAANDPTNALGMSAMLEEMLLRGAGERDSRAQTNAFDRLGVSRGCTTGTLSTTLSASLVADRLDQTLALMSEIVLEPRFDASSLEPTRALAKADLDALADEPTDRTILEAKTKHWAGVLGRSGYGTHAGLDSITREAIVEHWRAHAVPEGSIIAVAGHVDSDAIAAQLNTLLKGWSGSPTPIEAVGDPVRGYGHLVDQSEQVQIVVIHDAPLETDPIAWDYRVATQVLAGGMASRLFCEVREKRGLCYSVSSTYKNDPMRGWRTSYVGTTPPRAQESLDVLSSELERITQPAGEITPDEFARASAGLRSRVIFAGESTAARAAGLVGDMSRLGRPRSLAELAASIEAVTLESVNRVLEATKPSRATVQTLGPEALVVPAWLAD